MHALMWRKVKMHTQTCTHKHAQSQRLGFQALAPTYPPNSDDMFLSAWQMSWPTFTGEPWQTSLPHNPSLPTWILDSLSLPLFLPIFLSDCFFFCQLRTQTVCWLNCCLKDLFSDAALWCVRVCVRVCD